MSLENGLILIGSGFAHSHHHQHLLRGEGGVYYADLYPLISFLPRFSTHLEHASEDDMLPLWRASDMDHSVHKTMRQATMTSATTTMLRSNSAPLPRGSDEVTEKEMQEAQEWSNSFGRRIKRAKTFDPEAALPVLPSEQPLRPARNPPTTSLFDYIPFLRIFKAITKPLRRHKPAPMPQSARGRSLTGKKIRPEAADSNAPVEIALFLMTYYASLMKQGLLTPASATAMNNAITILQDTVVNLERIKNTPLPFAYQAHLRMSLW